MNAIGSRGGHQHGMALFLLCAALLGASAGAYAHPAWGLVVNRAGTVFFTDVNTNSVWMRTSDGRLTRLARGIHSHPLWIDQAEGWLYGEHVWWNEHEKRFDHYWWKLDSGGRLEQVSSLPDGLQWAADSHGTRYRADGARIQRVAANGEAGVVGDDSFGGLIRAPGHVNSVAVAPDRSLYVADSDNRCVWVIRPGEQARRVYTPERFWMPTGVAVSGTTLFVLEDRPNGPAVLLNYWAGPRLMRVTEGRAELVVVVDESREEVVVGVAGIILLTALGVAGVWKWRRRPRVPRKEPSGS
jgi:hypothetical protein